MAHYYPRLYRLKPWFIRALIPSGLIGTYVLYVNDSLGYRPVYTGRSDTDLRRRLINHPLMGHATHFDYDVFNSPEKAFIVECAKYHISTDIYLNQIHPATPANSNIKCPFCNLSSKYKGYKLLFQ